MAWLLSWSSANLMCMSHQLRCTQVLIYIYPNHCHSLPMHPLLLQTNKWIDWPDWVSSSHSWIETEQFLGTIGMGYSVRSCQRWKSYSIILFRLLKYYHFMQGNCLRSWILAWKRFMESQGSTIKQARSAERLNFEAIQVGSKLASVFQFPVIHQEGSLKCCRCRSI